MKKIYLIYLTLYLLISVPSFGASEGMPQLDSKFWISQIIWLTIIFSFLFIAIWKFFLPKISNNIENRKTKILNDLNEAENLKKAADKKLLDYNKIIEDSKNEAKKLIFNNKQKLEMDIKNKISKLNKEIEKEIFDIEQEIKNLKKSSLSAMNKIAVEISGEIVKQILGTEINKSSVSTIVESVSKERREESI